MLAHEKRRCTRSLALGIVAAGLVGSVLWVRALRTDRILEAQVLEYEFEYDKLSKHEGAKANTAPGSIAAAPGSIAGYPVNTPAELKRLMVEKWEREHFPQGGRWIPEDPELAAAFRIVDNARIHAQEAHNDIWLYTGLTLFVFGLPLIWYFLIDRVRELSDAVSGRDRQSE